MIGAPSTPEPPARGSGAGAGGAGEGGTGAGGSATAGLAEGPQRPRRAGDGSGPLVALAGNPNTGKTTLFNRLTGASQKVGNYPGITVERFTGRLRLPSGAPATAMDVPGAYSLSARSMEEQLAIAALAGLPPHPRPDVVVVVVDATQLARNLYLVLQVLELGQPTVVALNMVDMLRADGVEVERETLERELGVPVVPVSGLRGTGVDELGRAVEAVLADPRRGLPGWRWRPTDAALVADIESVAEAVPEGWSTGDPDRRRALALWALLSVDETDELVDVPPALRARALERRARADAEGREVESAAIGGRYGWIDERADTFLRRATPGGPARSERIDGVLLHPVFGFAIFLLLMGVLFQALFSGADPAITWIEEGVMAPLAAGVEALLAPGLLREFLTEGVIAGVGSVVVFLPQILLLFFFLGLMEDSGYMARVAFLMDRIMKKIGLHGRAFVPMMSGFACAIPAVMATRTMERHRDRVLTMMVVPLMTCSARLPVYMLLIAALFPPSEVLGFVPVQGLLMIAMYLFSTLTALAAAAVLGRTLLRGPRIPLILELPPYRAPHLPSVLRMMWQRSALFLKEAGTVILVCTVGLWLLLSFPKELPADAAAELASERTAAAEALAGPQLDARLAELADLERSALLRESYAGRLGRSLEPAIEPLGFDWKIGVGLIGAFAAREVFVSTMGVVYGIGEGADEESLSLRENIRQETRADGRLVYTPLVGLSLMVFFALACQCMSTLAAVGRETRSWRWPAFLFVYMTVLAWLASFAVYQGGKLFGFS